MAVYIVIFMSSYPLLLPVFPFDCCLRRYYGVTFSALVSPLLCRVSELSEFYTQFASTESHKRTTQLSCMAHISLAMHPLSTSGEISSSSTVLCCAAGEASGYDRVCLKITLTPA